MTGGGPDPGHPGDASLAPWRPFATATIAAVDRTGGDLVMELSAMRHRGLVFRGRLAFRGVRSLSVTSARIAGEIAPRPGYAIDRLHRGGDVVVVDATWRSWGDFDEMRYVICCDLTALERRLDARATLRSWTGRRLAP